MSVRVTFSPFTAEPGYVQAVTEAVVQAQVQFVMAAWAAQVQFVQALAGAALAAHWSVAASLRQARSHPR